MVTHRCEKFWFYIHDVIDRTSVFRPIHESHRQTPTFALFLLSSSTHKKAIPFSLALRLRRICSTDETFKIRTTELTTYLLKRGYKRNFVTKQIQRAADIPRTHTLQPKQIDKPKRIPFITTYNSSLPSIFNIIKKHYNLLLSSDLCKNVFLHLPVVSFRRSPNLRDLLVTAKLSPNVTHSNSHFLTVLFAVAKTALPVLTFSMD